MASQSARLQPVGLPRTCGVTVAPVGETATGGKAVWIGDAQLTSPRLPIDDPAAPSDEDRLAAANVGLHQSKQYQRLCCSENAPLCCCMGDR